MKHPAFVCCAVSFLFLGATSVQAQETSDLTDVHFYPPSAVSMMIDDLGFPYLLMSRVMCEL